MIIGISLQATPCPALKANILFNKEKGVGSDEE